MIPAGQRADAFTEEIVLRLADVQEVLASYLTRAARPLSTPTLFLALDRAVRGDSGFLAPTEWQDERRRALAQHGDYLGLAWPGEPNDRDPRQRSTQLPGAWPMLAEWGIVRLIGDYRAAAIERRTTVRTSSGEEVEIVRHGIRSAFTTECIDCGSSPHVRPDDHSTAVCLRCGRDKWL